MNEDLLKVIGTGIATILSAVVTILIKNYFDRKKEGEKYRSVETAIQEAVGGKWKGYIKQSLNGDLLFENVKVSFKVSDNGSIKGEMKVPYKDELYELKCTGGFYSQRFMKLEYENSNKAILQFGSMVIKLSDDSIKLEGYFVGNGVIGRNTPVSKNIIAGEMFFVKG